MLPFAIIDCAIDMLIAEHQSHSSPAGLNLLVSPESKRAVVRDVDLFLQHV